MASRSRDSAHQKLSLGTKRLKQAGDDSDRLGLALQAIHGALEDYLRVWISEHPHVRQETRREIFDLREYNWRDLLDHLDTYAKLDDELRELRAAIPEFNRQRQQMAHGGHFEGTRPALERYASLVQRTFERGIVPVASSRVLPQRADAGARSERSALEAARVRELKIARLDREWRMERQSYMIRARSGRPIVPTRAMSITTGVLSAIFALVWLAVAAHASIGVLVPLALVGYSYWSYKKAVSYDAAETRYLRARAGIQSGRD